MRPATLNNNSSALVSGTIPMLEMQVSHRDFYFFYPVSFQSKLSDLKLHRDSGRHSSQSNTMNQIKVRAMSDNLTTRDLQDFNDLSKPFLFDSLMQTNLVLLLSYTFN